MTSQFDQLYHRNQQIGLQKSSQLTAEETFQQIQRLLQDDHYHHLPTSNTLLESAPSSSQQIAESLPITLYQEPPSSSTELIPSPTNSLTTDEESFHDILKQYLHENGLQSIPNLETFSQLMNSFSSYIDTRYQTLKKQYERQEISRVMNVHNTYVPDPSSNLFNKDSLLLRPNHDFTVITNQSLKDYKSERDFWLLLQYLSSADLLYNLQDEEKSKESLEKALGELSIHANIPEHINTAYLADERLRKGAILTEWLESSALDEIISIPRPLNEPWSETWYHVTHRKPGTSAMNLHSIRSLDPDAQIQKDGKVLPLSSNDQTDQEKLWKAIWKLIRAGKLPEAQQLAADHHVFWFASALRGGEYHYYEEIPPEERQQNDLPSKQYRRVGNPKQPFWLQICWKYAEHLANNPENWKMSQQTIETITKELIASSNSFASSDNANPASLTGIIEMTIFASLSNHLEILLKSPLVSSFTDKLWIYLKAVHTHNIMLIVNLYRKTKYQSSTAYLACDLETIEQEEKMISALEISLQTILSNHNLNEIAFIDNFKELLTKVLPQPKVQYLYQFHSTSAGNAGAGGGRAGTAEYVTLDILLLHFEVAIIEGTTGLQKFLHFISNSSIGINQHTDLLTTISTEANPEREAHSELFTSTFPCINNSHLLRVFSHFLIWSKVFGNVSTSSASPAVNNNRHEFAQVISDGLYYNILQQYIMELIQKKLFQLIPLYCCFLNHTRLIANYSILYLVLQELYLLSEAAATVAAGEAPTDRPAVYREIFNLCNQYFPQYTIEMIRTVLQILYHGRQQSILGSFPELFPSAPSSARFAGEEESGIAADPNVSQDENYFSKLSFPSATFTGHASSNKSPPTIRTQPPRFGKFSVPSPKSVFASSIGSEDFSESLHYKEVHTSHADLLLVETLYWLSLDSEHSLELLKQSNRMILYFFNQSIETNPLPHHHHQQQQQRSKPQQNSHLFARLHQIDKLIQHYIPIDLLQKGNQIQEMNFLKLQQYLQSIQQQIQQTLFPTPQDEFIFLQTKQIELIQLMKIIYLEYDYWMINQYKLLYYHLIITSEQYYEEQYQLQYHQIEKKRRALSSVGGQSTVQQLSIQSDVLQYVSTSKEYLQTLLQLLLFEDNEEVIKLNTQQGENHWKRKIAILAKPFFAKGKKDKRGDTSNEQEENAGGAGQRRTGGGGEPEENNTVLYGYYDLWKESNYTLLKFIDSLFHTVITILEQVTRGEGEGGLAGESIEEVDNPLIIQTIEQLLHSLRPYYTQSSSHSNQTFIGSAIFTQYNGLFQRIVGQYQWIQQTLHDSPKLLTSITQDGLLTISSQLKEIIAYSQDIAREYQLKEALLFQLLSRYLQVCNRTAQVLQEIDNLAEVIEFYSLAIDLANLVASDDQSLLLHTILSKDHLESFLQEINKTIVRMIEINPNYLLIN